MASVLEEKLREAACVGDIEAVITLLSRNIDINSKNNINGWTALHWAAKRGHEDIARLLIAHGADPKAETQKGETPASVSTNPIITRALLGGTTAGEVSAPSALDHNNSSPTIIAPQHNIVNSNNTNNYCGSGGEDSSSGTSGTGTGKFVPNYIRNAPLNGQQVDVGRLRSRHPDFSSMPTTSLPATQNDDLMVLSVRISGSNDPDFIEIEIPRWRLTYANLMKICCEELEVPEAQVERIRKLPNTRLRNDSDIKRLNDFKKLELVLKAPTNNSGDKTSNCYQSISTCKDQTILY